MARSPALPPGAPQEWKASQKKRDIPKELRHDPPVLQVLGSGLVALEPLLAGESVVSTVCNFGVVRTPESDRLTFARVPQAPATSLPLYLVLPTGSWAGGAGPGPGLAAREEGTQPPPGMAMLGSCLPGDP